MDCPRCGAVTPEGEPECPSCGVVLAKARPGPPRPRRLRLPEREPRHPPAWRALLLPGLALALLAGAAFVSLRATSTGPGDRPDQPARSSTARPLSDAPVPELRVEAPPPPRVDARSLDGKLNDQDATDARRLVSKLEARASIDGSDLAAAERLFDASPTGAAALYASVLARAAFERRARHDYDRAAELLERAAVVAPGEKDLRRALLAVRLDQRDWPRLEIAAAELLRLAADDGVAVVALAHALVHQDRSREAIELLKRHLDDLERSGGRDSAGAAALYARLRNDRSLESPLQEHTLSHFHVRYDGTAHEDVGRAILLVLERHYATLARTFARAPGAPIPVVLLSEQSYYGPNGAPAWSGGQYDTFNGGVRMPIRGLSSALAPDLEQALIHELTHAFVTECSAGQAPRILQEGLAQLMEGARLDSQLGPDGLRALAEGRIQGVDLAYLAALGLVEELVAQRGQGGINELLETMSRTRDVNGAFRQVYGRSLEQLQRDWATRLQQRFGSS